MAVLNFYIAGVRGSILHQNTLTLEVYECWRVNNYINYGLPIPHIELVSESEAYNFIGVTANETKPIELKEQKEAIQTKLW